MPIIHKKLLMSVCIIVTSISFSTAYAAKHKVKKTKLYTDNHWFYGIGGGAGWTHLSGTTTVLNGSLTPPPTNVDTYTIHNPSTQPIAQLLLGYRWHKKKTYLPYIDLFLQYRHYFGQNITGTVQQYSLPGFTNYSYRMKYRADLITLTGKFDLFEFKKTLPYVSVGGGVIINNLSNYNENPLSGVTAPRINPGFQATQDPKWAGTLGAGFDFILNKCTWLTLGYEHVFQGTLQSGSGQGSWAGTKLNFGNGKLDTVFLNLSANIPQT